MTTFIKKTNHAGQPISTGESLKVNLENLVGRETKSLKIKEFSNKQYLTQKNCGGSFSGAICEIKSDGEFLVSENLFRRIKQFAAK